MELAMVETVLCRAWDNAAVVTNVHKTGAIEVGNEVSEGNVWIESNTKIADTCACMTS